MPGIFTDEPSIRGYYKLFNSYSYAWVAWTERFPAYLIIRDSGRVEEGKFAIGQAIYSLVVLPPMLNLLSSTLKLLKSYLDRGGQAVSVGPFPLLVDGERSQEADELARHPNLRFCDSIFETPGLLEALVPRTVSVKGRFGQEDEAFLCMVRELPDCRMTFIVNNDREMSHDVSIILADADSIEEWNPLTGETKGKQVRRSEGKLHLKGSYTVRMILCQTWKPDNGIEQERQMRSGRSCIETKLNRIGNGPRLRRISNGVRKSQE